MDKCNVIICCDESARSDMLIARLRSYDRRLARHTFDEYEYTRDFMPGAVTEKVVTQIDPGSRYSRCVIMTGIRISIRSEQEMIFHDCLFIGVNIIMGVIMSGENTWTGGDILVRNIGILGTKLMICSALLGEFNEIVCNKEKVKFIRGIPEMEVTPGISHFRYAHEYMNMLELASEKVGTSLGRPFLSEGLIWGETLTLEKPMTH